MRALSTAVAGAALAFAFGLSSGVAYGDPPAPPPPPGPPPGPVPAMDHDGTYAVGSDIQPGTYASGGPLDGVGACYWKRQGGPTGQDIIDNAMTKKPQVVQIAVTDTSFKTTGCQPWVRTNAPPPPPPTNPLLGLLELRGMMGTVNAGAGAIGLPPLPPP